MNEDQFLQGLKRFVDPQGRGSELRLENEGKISGTPRTFGIFLGPAEDSCREGFLSFEFQETCLGGVPDKRITARLGVAGFGAVSEATVDAEIPDAYAVLLGELTS